jgi:LDH2 family malate/lactate/ureidoglycolate dehydrogenase
LGTNPLSIAVPAGKGMDPVVLDMATSNAARGKIIVAKTKGDTIPEGWAVTKDGEPTTDPVAALEGLLLPMGSKGSGLAIMVDILSGVLTGAWFGKRVPRMYEDPEPQRIGHFFGVIKVDAFMDAEEFGRRIQEKVDETVNSKPAKGFDRVYMPGEIETLKMKKQLAEGIALSPAIFRDLEQTGKQYGVDIQAYL